MTRQLIIVDTETTGLHDTAAILEIAAVNVDTGEELYFVPAVTREQLSAGQPKALQINRYYERGLFEQALSALDTGRKYKELRDMLDGNTFGGSNPAFDSRLLAAIEARVPAKHQTFGMSTSYEVHRGAVWHHRLADLAAYAAGVLHLPPTELPGMANVCELLGVVNEEAHSALADAQATAECFRRLMRFEAARA